MSRRSGKQHDTSPRLALPSLACSSHNRGKPGSYCLTFRSWKTQKCHQHQGNKASISSSASYCGFLSSHSSSSSSSASLFFFSFCFCFVSSYFRMNFSYLFSLCVFLNLFLSIILFLRLLFAVLHHAVFFPVECSEALFMSFGCSLAASLWLLSEDLVSDSGNRNGMTETEPTTRTATATATNM